MLSRSYRGPIAVLSRSYRGPIAVLSPQVQDFLVQRWSFSRKIIWRPISPLGSSGPVRLQNCRRRCFLSQPVQGDAPTKPPSVDQALTKRRPSVDQALTKR